MAEEIRRRLDAQARSGGDFARVHVAPSSGADVVDEPTCRLVVLPSSRTHLAKSVDSPALALARELLDSRYHTGLNCQEKPQETNMIYGFERKG